MCRKLPLNNFEWIGNPNEMFTTKSILNYDEETNEKGCLLEVDIEYPKELHNAHSKLPFCPLKDKKTSTNTRYSKAIQKARKKNEEFLAKATEKLETTLYDKQNM